MKVRKNIFAWVKAVTFGPMLIAAGQATNNGGGAIDAIGIALKPSCGNKVSVCLYFSVVL
jgi:hypothetical protein